MKREGVDVLIVGAGPAGLAAAWELGRKRVGQVVVVEREDRPGGIPRQSNHVGYGLLDLHRLATGPEYAERWARMAVEAGAQIRTETAAVGWTGDRRVLVTSPKGPTEMAARAVLLATGCRERPRSARLIPGDRPPGVFTTGSLQRFVHLHGRSVGRRAIVVGAEHVSFSALLTLKVAHVRVLALTTEHPRHQTYPPLAFATASRMRVPVLGGQRLTAILGHTRVEAVELTDLATGASRLVACDTVILTGDWIPDHELARLAGLEMDPGTRGPRVDQALRTSHPGIFAAGNLLHGAETSDVATSEGRRVAASVVEWLATGCWMVPRVPVFVHDPMLWAVPSAVEPNAVRRGHVTLRVRRFIERGVVEVQQGERRLWRGHARSGMLAAFAPFLPEPMLHGALVPNRPLHIPTTWLADVRPDGGPVELRIRE